MSLREQELYEFGQFRLHVTEHFLERTDGERVPLSEKAFDTLCVLVRNAGHLVLKSELLDQIWAESFVEENNLNKCIHAVRRALGEKPGERFIETVQKQGYRFVAEVQTFQPQTPAEIIHRENGFRSTSNPQPSAGFALVTERTEPQRSGTVVALADWQSDEVKDQLDESVQRPVKLALAPARPVIKSRPNYLALALAGLTLGAIGLGYYFLTATRGGDAIESVAVLPFVNATGDPSTDYLADGVTSSIISSLLRLPSVKVNSLNSVMRYRGKEVDSQTVGHELNVRAVLMGRMTQRGDDLTISAELVDVADNRLLWNGQYSRKLSDILDIQRDIAQQISEGLRLRLSGKERKDLAKQHTENSDAYLLYSLGGYYFRQNTKEGFDKSIESYEQAIKLDANYALAYVGLARTYQFMGSRAFGPPKDTEQNVEWAALKALQLDETLAEGHVFLGVNKFSDFDWVGAEKEIKRALELDPNSSLANATYFFYLTGIGRPSEGLPYLVKSHELESVHNPGELAFAYFMARQYDKAIELYRKALEKNPDNAHAHVLLGEAYVANGMLTEGLAATQKGISLDATLDKTPERWDRYPLLAYTFAAAGRRDEALKILDEQHALAKQSYVSPYNFAIIYTGLGDKDQAFAWLEKCIEQRTRIISFHFKSRPLFDTLRSDPRYSDLLRKMNLEP